MDFVLDYLSKKKENETTIGGPLEVEDTGGRKNELSIQLEDKDQRHQDLVVMRSKTQGYMLYQKVSSIEENISIQTKVPLKNRGLIAYYEFTVLKQKQTGVACIGLARKGYDIKAQPGWQENSIGYHSDDARVYTGNSSLAKIQLGDDYQFSVNDTVGCGVEFPKRNIFFTKNGKLIENNALAKYIVGFDSLYPTIGLDHVALKLNFGERPFAYNIEKHNDTLKDSVANQLKWTKVPPYRLPPHEIKNVEESGDISHLKWYLVQKGYTQTLTQLVNDNVITIPSGLLESMERRSALVKQIRDGQAGDVLVRILNEPSHEIYENFRDLSFKPMEFSVATNIKLCKKKKSMFLKKSMEEYHNVNIKKKNVLILLLLQAVIEKVIENDVHQALELLRSDSFFVTIFPNCPALISLIGDRHVRSNPEIAPLLDDVHRQKVADAFHKEYLSLANYPNHTSIEMISTQLQIVLGYLLNPQERERR